MPLLEATYINHKGNKVAFGSGNGLFLNQHDLMNFSWNAQTRGNRIISMNRRGVRENTLPLVITGTSKEEACKLANDLFSICEADMQANKKGRIVVNGYNLNCFVRGQDFSDWSDISKCLKISAHIIRDSVWYKALESITFNNSEIPLPVISEPEQGVEASPAASSGDEWTGGDKGYYFGYPYDYPNTAYEYLFENKEDVPLSWRAIIYGATENPSFTIAGHEYKVNVLLGAGERLEITAKEALDEKTVYKYDADGNRTNCFANRSTTSYLFEPIPTKTSKITFASGLVWELQPIVERSAPKWL